jgi:hypothetical protein
VQLRQISGKCSRWASTTRIRSFSSPQRKQINCAVAATVLELAGLLAPVPDRRSGPPVELAVLAVGSSILLASMGIPGASTTFNVTFPVAAGAHGATATLRITGAYTVTLSGGASQPENFSSGARVALP